MRTPSCTLLCVLVATHILASSTSISMTLAGSSGPASIQTGSNEDQHQVRSYHKFAALAAPSSLIDQEEQRTRGSSSSFITSPPDWLRSLPEEISVENSTRRPANEAQRLNGSAAATTMTASAPGTPTGETNSQPVPVTVIELTIFQAIESHYLRHSPSVSMIMIIGYTIVFLVGIVGNSFVVAIVCKSPRMRTVTNYFIVNLALADILVLLFCLPATLVGNLFIPYLLGLFVCKTVSYLQGVAVSASINTLVAVTADRFFAICFPMDWHMSRRKVRWTIACIWLFSLSISLPWAIYFNLLPFSIEAAPGQLQYVNVCAEDWPSERIGTWYFVLANLILCYLLPAVIIILCYLGIWYKIERRNIPGDRPKGLKIELIMQKSRLKVVKMMMVVVIIFLLSWLPLYLMFARIKLVKDRSEWEEWLIGTLMPLAQWLGASNSCINPILYTFFNRKYKRGFIGFLRYGFCCDANASGLDITRTTTVIRNSNGAGAATSSQDKSYMRRLQHHLHMSSNNIQIPLETLDSHRNPNDRRSSSSYRTAGQLPISELNSTTSSGGTFQCQRLVRRARASIALATNNQALVGVHRKRRLASVGQLMTARFGAQTSFIEGSSTSSTVLQASWSDRGGSTPTREQLASPSMAPPASSEAEGLPNTEWPAAAGLGAEAAPMIGRPRAATGERPLTGLAGRDFSLCIGPYFEPTSDEAVPAFCPHSRGLLEIDEPNCLPAAGPLADRAGAGQPQSEPVRIASLVEPDRGDPGPDAECDAKIACQDVKTNVRQKNKSRSSVASERRKRRISANWRQRSQQVSSNVSHSSGNRSERSSSGAYRDTESTDLTGSQVTNNNNGSSSNNRKNSIRSLNSSNGTRRTEPNNPGVRPDELMTIGKGDQFNGLAASTSGSSNLRSSLAILKIDSAQSTVSSASCSIGDLDTDGLAFSNDDHDYEVSELDEAEQLAFMDDDDDIDEDDEIDEIDEDDEEAILDSIKSTFIREQIKLLNQSNGDQREPTETKIVSGLTGSGSLLTHVIQHNPAGSSSNSNHVINNHHQYDQNSSNHLRGSRSTVLPCQLNTNNEKYKLYYTNDILIRAEYPSSDHQKGNSGTKAEVRTKFGPEDKFIQLDGNAPLTLT